MNDKSDKDKGGGNTFVTSHNQSGGITAGTVNMIPPQRHMDAQVAAKLSSMIPRHVKVHVSAVWGDQEAFQFATEITAWLREQGWDVGTGTSQSMWSQPIVGVACDVSNPNETEIRVGRHHLLG